MDPTLEAVMINTATMVRLSYPSITFVTTHSIQLLWSHDNLFTLTLTNPNFHSSSNPGMDVSTPSASAQKKRPRGLVRPLTIPISPNFATSRYRKEGQSKIALCRLPLATSPSFCPY
jgi:hypothetical protein